MDESRKQTPLRRATIGDRMRAALTARWRLHDTARYFEQKAKLADQEIAFLREQLAAFRDTCQSLQELHRANGAEASVAIEMLRDEQARRK